MKLSPKRKAWVLDQIAAQRRWIADHGGDLAGYIAHYDSKHDPKYYGDGGEAIYSADINAMLRYQEMLK